MGRQSVYRKSATPRSNVRLRYRSRLSPRERFSVLARGGILATVCELMCCLDPSVEGVARHVGVPVHECACRIVLPRPYMQRVEGRESEAVRSFEEMKELSHKLGRGRVCG